LIVSCVESAKYEALHQESKYQSAGSAGRDFSKLTTYLKESYSWQEPEDETLPVPAQHSFTRHFVNKAHNGAHDQEADDYSRRAEVDVELQDRAHAYTGALGKDEPGIFADYVPAAASNWFVAPDRSGNESENRVDDCFALRELLMTAFHVSYSQSDERALVKPPIDSVQMRWIVGIE
jgi:hypothetical protein